MLKSKDPIFFFSLIRVLVGQNKNYHIPVCVCALCNPMDCSPPGSSVHGILQARILEWVAISSSRGSSRPRDRTSISALAGGFFTTEPPGKPKGIEPRLIIRLGQKMV